jgi:hypothetical protein
MNEVTTHDDGIERDDGIAVYRGRKVLLVGIAAWSVVWLIHHGTGVTSDKAGSELLFRVGVICAVCGVVMLTWTRGWTLMKFGLMALLLSMGYFLIRFLSQHGHQPPGEWERDLVQSGLEVGGAALIISTASWVAIKEYRRVKGWRARRAA